MTLKQKIIALAQRALGRSDVLHYGSLYMRRWRIVHTKWFGIRVHNIMRSDVDHELHDHPFDFVSIILRGGYVEVTEDEHGVRAALAYKPGSVIFRKAESLHKLYLNSKVKNGLATGEEIPAWTLVIRGPIRRDWGFKLRDGTWQIWSDFVARRRNPAAEKNPYVTPSST